MLPFTYAIRNLLRRPGRAAHLILGTALVVSLLLLAAALNEGMRTVLASSGQPSNVILLGTGSEESIERSEVPLVVPEMAAAGVPGLRAVLGTAAVSGEVHFNGLVSVNGDEPRQTLLRGVTPQALLVHPRVRIIQGRFPRSGECMVGRLAHHKMRVPQAALQVGEIIQFNDGEFTVAGVFDAPGTVMEAEIWMNANDLLTYTQRGTLSCAVVMMDEGTFSDADLFTKQRLDLELTALREQDYYAKLSDFYQPVRWMVWLCALFISAGAVFGGLNTLHAAFASRARELAALQAIGYTRTALLISLVEEAAFATLAGALLASSFCLLTFDGLTVPFSAGTFTIEFGPQILALGLLAGLLLGVAGALPPAWVCLRPDITSSLRAP